MTPPISSPRLLQGIRRSLYATAAGGIQVFSQDPDFAPDRYRDDEQQSPTRLSQRDRVRLSYRYSRDTPLPSSVFQDDIRRGDRLESENPFDDSRSTESRQDTHNPFDDSNTAEAVAEPEPPYHIFSQKQKWFVIAIIGVAGLFSGLSSNIFFPSLDAIAKDLNVSLNMVSLTITSYLIIQGISPLFWGSISDALGRRPIYIASFAVYIVANIALSFSPNFAVLLIFRGLQAAGSASTVSIGNGVIQDITPPAERGAFISFYSSIRNFSIAIGPVLGGILSNFFGFRSIFIFLLILSSITTLVIIVFLPETMRTIAGNGTLRLQGVYKPLIQRFRKEPEYMQDPEERTPKKITLGTFTEPLKLLIQKDILINLIFGGVVYTIWSMVTSSTTGLFKEKFNLSELQVGLAFLPNGFGTIVGSSIAGKYLTKDYLATESAYKTTHKITSPLSSKSLPVDFPIEHARLRRLPLFTSVFILSTSTYGLSLSTPLTSLPGWIAVPLTLQFFIAATSNGIFSLNQTLVSDLCPGKGASASAMNNLVRCSLGAVGVAFIEPMLAAVGPGATFLGLGMIIVAVGPLAVVHWFWGAQWRVERTTAKIEDEKEKSESGASKV
ncbi:major facilitator superfamily transporter [Ilyonectria sp. MPI-CAGE-AT-0026]|nr:major facilitator superfamily transporter [Ilyonectria sp. MPI-CAGE-AT-0026]